jgi:2-keto-4-pentenoate hydratase/2-oxohepta-3-ene-1,7-dioic acid hydratase in catechol pathway
VAGASTYDVPNGTAAAIKPGDEVEVELEGAGTLVNRVVGASGGR